MKNRPGYKTTEFWLTTATMMIGLLIASGVFEIDSMALRALSFLASALAAMGYSYGRSLIKS